MAIKSHWNQEVSYSFRVVWLGSLPPHNINFNMKEAFNWHTQVVHTRLIDVKRLKKSLWKKYSVDTTVWFTPGWIRMAQFCSKNIRPPQPRLSTTTVTSCCYFVHRLTYPLLVPTHAMTPSNISETNAMLTSKSFKKWYPTKLIAL